MMCGGDKGGSKGLNRVVRQVGLRLKGQGGLKGVMAVRDDRLLPVSAGKSFFIGLFTRRVPLRVSSLCR